MNPMNPSLRQELVRSLTRDGESGSSARRRVEDELNEVPG